MSILFVLMMLPAEAQPVVAVFDIHDETNKQQLARRLTDQLRVELASTKKLIIIDKGEQEAQVKKLLKEQKTASYQPCVDDACQIPLGKELAANQILRTRLVRFGKSYRLSSELIDVATGGSAGGASVDTDGTDQGLLRGVELLARRITGTGPLEGGSGETVVLGGGEGGTIRATGGEGDLEDGIVRFESDPPGLAVSVDGKRLPGVTPFEDFIALGKRNVRVAGVGDNSSRFKPHEASMVLKAGMTLSVRLEEITGEVVVVARDERGQLVRNVPIHLDGKLVAKAPVRLRGISFGSHEVRLQSEHGAIATKSVSIRSPEAVRIDLVVPSAAAWKEGEICDTSGVVCLGNRMFIEPQSSEACEDSSIIGFAGWKPAAKDQQGDLCHRFLSRENTATKAFRAAYQSCLDKRRFCVRKREEWKRDQAKKPL